MINEPTPYYQRVLRESGDRYYVLSMRNRNPAAYIYQLSRILKKDKIDILHAHGNSATLFLEMAAGTLAGIPVRIAHSRNSFCQHQIVDRILRPFFYASYTNAFAVSEKAGDWLFGKRPYTVIPNGNDIEKFRYREEIRSAQRQKLEIAPDEIAIGHVGTLSERKNQSFTLDILAELIRRNHKKYMLFFWGDGKKREELGQKVNALGLGKYVRFPGFTDCMEDVLQAMDLMVLPSLFEGLPNSLIEWQAACLPSVVADTVTKQARVTNLPVYLSLEDGAGKWADVIEEIKIPDRAAICEKTLDEIRRANFDIQQNAKYLEGVYETEYGKTQKKTSG